MNRQKAQEINDTILVQIKDYIPDAVVNPLWLAYVEEFNPSDRHAPCTCNPKTWVSILDQLRARVVEALNAEVVTVENQVIVKREKKTK